MKENLNTKLIEAISGKLPQKINLASYLINTLSISKEAAYRRLRGEVAFTFDETVQISSKLDISLDRMIGANDSDDAIMNVDLVKSPDDISNYNETLEKYLNICNILKKDPQATMSEATNKLPIHSYAAYPTITKFWVSRWLHQSNNIMGKGGLDDSVDIPLKMMELHQQLATELRYIPLSVFIWDKNIFKNFVNAVLYFARLNLLSPDDVENIRKELLCLLNELEEILATATYKEGGKVYIYICDIPVVTIYSYMESKDIQISMLRVYAINLIDSLHPDIFALQKDWVQSLRRYSTLITDSSEMERIRFLDLQREYANSLKV